MNLTFIIFTCLVFLVAGSLLAWFVSSDDFEGTWVSIGVMEGHHLVPFPGNTVSHTLSFDEGYVAYFINNDQIPATRSGRSIRVELAAQIYIEYKMAIREGHLVLTDPHGTRLVFEKTEYDEE